METGNDDNKQIVESLYVALANGDTYTAAGILAADLEWWFHGPPGCQHMKRMLTGESTHRDFRFKPRRVTQFGSRVVVEGWEGEEVYWVHVWTVKEGVITQFREYFNTWLTVRGDWKVGPGRQQDCPTMWQSEPREHLNRSLPGLVLDICFNG